MKQGQAIKQGRFNNQTATTHLVLVLQQEGTAGTDCAFRQWKLLKSRPFQTFLGGWNILS